MPRSACKDNRCYQSTHALLENRSAKLFRIYLNIMVCKSRTCVHIGFSQTARIYLTKFLSKDRISLDMVPFCYCNEPFIVFSSARLYLPKPMTFFVH